MRVGLCYHEHRSVDSTGFITDVYVTPGNVSERKYYISSLKRQIEKFNLPLKNVGADAAYGVAEIYKGLHEMGLNVYIPQRTKGRKKEGMFRREDYIYDKEKGVYICPEGEVLKKGKLSKKNNNYTYCAKQPSCRNCKSRNKCLKSKSKTRAKSFTRHKDQDLVDEILAKSKSQWKYFKIKRSIISEGSFADAKNNHGLGRAKFRGLKKVQEQSLLTAIAQNIKKMVKKMNRKKVIPEVGVEKDKNQLLNLKMKLIFICKIVWQKIFLRLKLC